MAPKPRRSKPKDNGRRGKKKISVLNTDKIEYVDYKDLNLLRKFISDRAKIRARRVTGNNTQQQREVAQAIKNAREMALLPYTNRVTTQRGQRNDRGRAPQSERPPTPTASTPPPTARAGGPEEADGDVLTEAPPAEDTNFTPEPGVVAEGVTFEGGAD